MTKVVTMDWKVDVKDEEYYNKLVATGYAWVLYSDLPLTWAECLVEKEKEVE
jgi:hypothetical protein